MSSTDVFVFYAQHVLQRTLKHVVLVYAIKSILYLISKKEGFKMPDCPATNVANASGTWKKFEKNYSDV